MAIVKNDSQEVQGGIVVSDGITEGPFYTGGPNSPVGLDLPTDTIYVQNTASGTLIWQKFGASTANWRLYPAIGSFFNNSTNAFTAVQVQAAIEEARATALTGEVSASSASANASTGADALMTSMTTGNLAAGKYLVWFSTDITLNAGSNVISVSLYVGGTQKADSIRKFQGGDGGALAGGGRVSTATQGKCTVNGSQAIEVRWSASAGTNTAAARTLNWMRVEN